MQICLKSQYRIPLKNVLVVCTQLDLVLTRQRYLTYIKLKGGHFHYWHLTAIYKCGNVYNLLLILAFDNENFKISSKNFVDNVTVVRLFYKQCPIRIWRQNVILWYTMSVTRNKLHRCVRLWSDNDKSWRIRSVIKHTINNKSHNDVTMGWKWIRRIRIKLHRTVTNYWSSIISAGYACSGIAKPITVNFFFGYPSNN